MLIISRLKNKKIIIERWIANEESYFRSNDFIGGIFGF